LGDEIAKAGVDLLLAVGQFGPITAASAEKAAEKQLQIVCCSDTASTCNILHELVRKQDIILVKGSRAAGLEAIVERLKELYAPAKVPYPIEELAPALPARLAAEPRDESRIMSDGQ
jgi:hypothetical protein